MVGLGLQPCNFGSGDPASHIPWLPSDQPSVCCQFDSAGLFQQLRDDLGRYAEMSPEQHAIYTDFCSARRKRACVTIRIVGGVPYVLDLFPGYQSRMKATLTAIYRALQRLGPTPDVQIVVDVTDGELQNIDLPIFVITYRSVKPAGVLYPDFTFYSWPESACPPSEPSHAYTHLFRSFGQNWNERVAPWANRSDSLFWRGARVSDGGRRDRALLHLAEAPGTDARFMTWRAVAPTGQNEAVGCVGLLDQCQNRYLAFLAGTTYSSRIKFQLLCGSTVLASRLEFVEWWTHLMRPGVHYAEVLPDWSNSPSVLGALRERAATARAIASRGQRLALSLLSPAAVDCYWWQLLAAAARVLPQPPLDAQLPAHARPLEDVLLWPDGVVLSAEVAGPSGGYMQLVNPPFELRDPRCFDDGGGGSGLQWSHCCNAEAYGPHGDVRCWEHATDREGRALDFEHCCLFGRGA